MAAPGYGLKVNSNRTSAIVITIIIHGVACLIFINIRSVGNVHPYHEVMQAIQLNPETSTPELSPDLPAIHFQSRAIYVNPPDIRFDMPAPADLSVVHSASDTPYQLPDKNAALYPDVFDPKLRKQLQEAHANRKPAKKQPINSWVTAGGTTLADMGDGECIASIPKTDSRDRGTSWSMLRVKCGKSDSEKMMDNINADLEARKHPLGTQ